MGTHVMRPHSPELRIALAKIDRLMFHAVCEGHKRKARMVLREDAREDPVHLATAYSYRVLDRWFRRYARKHPMGKFIHGSTFEEPRRKS